MVSFDRANFIPSNGTCSPSEVYHKLLEPGVLEQLLKDHPYHNPQHLREVAKWCILLTERSIKYNPDSRMDPHLSAIAGLLHDIYYGDKLTDHKNFEERSAQEAYKLLKTLGLDERSAREIEVAIQETHAEVSPETLLGKILSAADLASSASSKERFEENFSALMAESEILRGPTSEENFFLGSMRFFGNYLARMIHLTPEAIEDGASVFHRNVLRYIVEKFRQLFPDKEIVCSIDDIPVGEGLNIVMAREPDRLAQKIQSGRGLTLVIPLVGDCIPLPNGVCNRVKGNHPDLLRVLATS